jgi:hypothetical protein
MATSQTDDDQTHALARDGRRASSDLISSAGRGGQAGPGTA